MQERRCGSSRLYGVAQPKPYLWPEKPTFSKEPSIIYRNDKQGTLNEGRSFRLYVSQPAGPGRRLLGDLGHGQKGAFIIAYIKLFLWLNIVYPKTIFQLLRPLSLDAEEPQLALLRSRGNLRDSTPSNFMVIQGVCASINPKLKLQNPKPLTLQPLNPKILHRQVAWGSPGCALIVLVLVAGHVHAEDIPLLRCRIFVHVEGLRFRA